MTLVQIKNVSKVFNHQDVLKNINVQIHPQTKVGLIGVNGSGKTTLFKLIMKQLEPDEGEVIAQKNLKISYLPQTPQLDEEKTIFESALQGYENLQKLETKLREIEIKLENASEDEIQELIEQHDKLLVQYEQADGYRYRSQTEAVLNGIGFTGEQFDTKIKVLSGGQKNRIALVQTLLNPDQLLLLDEPTNFLDIDAKEWLESYLKECNKTMIIISHDRYFLNQVTTQIWDIMNGQLTTYSGNFDKYLVIKKEKQERQQLLYEEQQEEIKRQKDFIRRNIVGQKHKQAQSRRKKLEKLQGIEAPVKNQDVKIPLNFSTQQISQVVEAQNLSHSFGDNEIFKNLHLSLDYNDKIAVIGPNGCGKSTLLHIIVNKFSPSKGAVKIGSKVKLGFYDQELRDLDLEETVFDSVKKYKIKSDDLEIRNFLALFLFCEDDIYKKIGTLSGGEKSRVAIAQLLIQKPNFLVLDEPTNHLDIKSREALEQALQQYDGTLLFVSHDRYFINQISNRLLYFYDKEWIKFNGNYSSFHESRESLLPEDALKKTVKKRTAYKNFQTQKKKKKYNINELEEKINEAETRMEEINKEWYNDTVYQNPDKIKSLKEDSENLRLQLEDLYKEWEDLLE